jgi:hypothetical protein
MREFEEKSGNEDTELVGPGEPDPGCLQSPSEKSKTPIPGSKNEVLVIPSRRATGPRTPAGKRRSSQNALKHSIFRCVALLDDESRKEYGSLLKGLRNLYQPVGDLEEFHVERAAMNIWRLRRVAIAERAEILRAQEVQEWDRKQRKHWEAEDRARRATDKNEFLGNPRLAAFFGPTEEVKGLIWYIENLEIMECCCEMLEELRTKLEAKGFCNDEERILERLYGERGQNHLRETLFDTYGKWSNSAEASTSKERKAQFLVAVDREILRLNHCREERVMMESHRVEIEKRRQLVPDSRVHERLMKYEITYSRQLDRTLHELERLQAMRLGRPVPPR